MRKFIKNKKGMTLIETFAYITMFLVVLMYSSSLIVDYNTVSSINKSKLLFNKDKDELFDIIGIDSNRIDVTSISIIEAISGKGNKLTYVVNDDISTPEDDSVKVEIIQGKNGLVMKRFSPSSSTSSNDLKSFSFESITQTDFYEIKKVCTDETLSIGCIEVANLYDIVVYGEEKINRRNTMNRAKRSFYFNE